MKLKTFLFVLVVGIVLLFTACELDGIVTVRVTGFADGVNGITFGVSTVTLIATDSNGEIVNETVTINASSVSAQSSTITGGTTVAGSSIVFGSTTYTTPASVIQDSATVVAGDTTISFSFPSDFQ